MPSSEAGRPCAVLVVEDDAILRLHALDIVEEAGFTAIEAKNADEAITILSGSLPDQSALYGVLYQLQSMGVTLLELRRQNKDNSAL